MPRGGDVEVAGPGIFRGCAPLEEQVGPSAVGPADPTVKPTVPQSNPARLALRNALPRRSSRLIQDVQQFLHTEKSSILASQHFGTLRLRLRLSARRLRRLVSYGLRTRRLKC